MEKNINTPFVKYATGVTVDNIDTITHFDLTGASYHGGTTLSSGALPKWDLLNNAYMIKRCGFRQHDGAFLTDAANEELVYRFCRELSIACAEYRTVEVRYFDEDLKIHIECPATLTKIFKGLVHLRDIRDLMDLGKANDLIIELADNFQINPQLNDQIFIDYIFDQSDRHTKNIGFVEKTLSPLFDSGHSLYFDVFDSELSPSYYDRVAKHKTFGKHLDELLRFALKYIHNGFSFDYDENNLVDKFHSVLKEMQHYYSNERYVFIENLVTRRIRNVGQILAEA